MASRTFILGARYAHFRADLVFFIFCVVPYCTGAPLRGCAWFAPHPYTTLRCAADGSALIVLVFGVKIGFAPTTMHVTAAMKFVLMEPFRCTRCRAVRCLAVMFLFDAVAVCKQNYTARLHTVPDYAQQNEALKFLVHFVGDTHQVHTPYIAFLLSAAVPHMCMHVWWCVCSLFMLDFCPILEEIRSLVGDALCAFSCYRAQRSRPASTHAGTFMGRSTNLHSLWDTGLVQKRIDDDFGSDVRPLHCPVPCHAFLIIVIAPRLCAGGQVY